MHILIAFDTTGFEESFLDLLSQTDVPADSTIRVMHVFSQAADLYEWPSTVSKENILESMDKFARVIQQQSPSLKVEIQVRHGDPVHEISEMVKTWNANLLMVGSEHKHRWEKLVFGSVSNSVCQQVDCPVIVVRQKNQKLTAAL
jgi:nucleotide-binding universal stress UspA family protein